MPDCLTPWIERLFRDPALAAMGHAQRPQELDLGLGWIYYGLARVARPERVVVIGSHRGFTPMVFARALADNGAGGRVVFIDPSMVDDFWKEPARVRAYFAEYGLDNIDHHAATTQDFVDSPDWHRLGRTIGILLVDGYHSEEQARFDHQAFEPLLVPGGFSLFHDSVRERISRIYGADRPYRHTVKRYMDALRADPAFEVLALPFGDGLCIVRRADGEDGA
jgi:predicted O-methyltransferase YrrM